MTLTWRKEHLDIILVPGGLLIMFGYHLFLLHRCQNFAQFTVIGYENHNKKAWVNRILQIDAEDRGPAVSVISSNIAAATNLSSICLALSGLIGTLIGSNSKSIFTSNLIYGATSRSVLSVKYISLLACLMVAFAAFVQAIRCFVHVNFLISMPNGDLPVSFVENAVIHGSNYWTIGMRVLHLAILFLLWIFGPIPMFVSSVVMVALLHALDRNNKPLHQYQPKPTSPKKIGREIIAMDGAIGHQSSARGNSSGTSGTLTYDHCL